MIFLVWGDFYNIMARYHLKHGITGAFHEVSREAYVHEVSVTDRHSMSAKFGAVCDDGIGPVMSRFYGQRPNGRLGPMHVEGYVEAEGEMPVLQPARPETAQPAEEVPPVFVLKLAA
jgi:hypothetical protein